MVLIYSDNLKDRREAFLIPGGGYGRTKCVRSSLGGAWLAVPEQPVCREEPSEEARVTLRGAVGPEGVPWPSAETQSHQHTPFPHLDPARLPFYQPGACRL